MAEQETPSWTAKADIPYCWVGKDVVLATAVLAQAGERAIYGRLQEATPAGIVLLEKRCVLGGEDRRIEQFYPRHTIYSLRLQGPQEKAE